MMSSSSHLLPQQQFLCPLCLHVFTDPVTTPCGHNFCYSCLHSAWDGGDGLQCPSCHKSYPSQPQMSVNAAFKEVCDAFRRMTLPQLQWAPKTGEVVCDVCAAASLQVKALQSCVDCLTSYCHAHLEPHRSVATLNMHRLIWPTHDLQDRMCKKHHKLLEMFCKDEQKCVCLFCTETEHKEHQSVSIEEESAEKKTQMKNTEAEFEQMIQERLKKVEEISYSLKLSAASAEQEVQDSDRLFTSLMISIRNRQSEARAEVEQKQKETESRAEELSTQLQQEISELQKRKSELRELRDTDDHFHLLQRWSSLSSPLASPEWAELSVCPQVCVGTLRRVVSQLEETFSKHLEQVRKQEMKRMQKYAVDVVLDPDTAHPNIVLSADGKQAGRGELLHIVPDIPQRFDPVICVLAKRGFLSGRFYFQVAVGAKTFWDLGVVRESVNRKGMITSKPDNGFWTVRLRGGDEYRALESPSVLLSLKEAPQTVGVYADYQERTVAFFNADSATHIYTFTGCSFSGRIFPFFSPGGCDDGKNVAPLVLTAVNHQPQGHD